MTYARSSGSAVRSGRVVGRAARAAASRSSSTRSPAKSLTPPWAMLSVSRTPALLSRSAWARRSAGFVGSSGRYAAPAFHTPSRARIRSGPRSRHTPTTVSSPTPVAARWWPMRLARSSTSR